MPAVARKNVVTLRRAVDAVVERLEDRRLMAGDASIVQTVPYSLDFSSAAGGIADKTGQRTGLTWVQPNTAGTEYQPGLINLDTVNGLLKLTTTGTSAAGGPWETDNSLVNSLQTQFDASTGSFTISVRLSGNLNAIAAASEQGGIIFGPDQDNYIKLVAVAQPNGQFIQFIDEQKPGSTFVHSIAQGSSYTSVGAFSGIQTLDLMIAGNVSTGLVTGFYRVNGGAVQQVNQSVTLTGTEKTAFFSTKARAGLIAMAKNDLAPITVSFDSFSIVNGTPVLQRPSVNGSVTSPADGSSNVSRNAFISAGVNLPNIGQGVDGTTLTSSTVQLYRTSDHTLVAGHLSTSGAGDTITFQPSSALDANTQYTFSVTSGVKDTSGSAFLPYTESFTTGTQIAAVNSSLAFEQVALPTATGQIYTAVTVGPDHKLYAATLTGLIQRFTINADGTLGAATNINTVTTAAGANRTITGLTFDPSSTATNLILWISNNQYATVNATDWTSKISKLTGPNLENIQDYVTGLPRSVRDHMTNQIAFGPDGALYVSQASNSAMGAPDSAWGDRAEHLLNAAILRVDTSAIDARLAAGKGPLNVQTEGLGANNYNPYAAGAPLTIYATGVRNSYDLVWTKNGQLLASTNGSAAGGNTPAYPNSTFSSQRIDGTTWTNTVAGLTNVGQTEDDFLYNVAQGGYYGHPDPARGEYVLDGGNPTAGTDPAEFTAYAVGTQPDYNYRGYTYDYGASHSPDGMIQYSGNAFGGALNGSLMVVRYSGGADVQVLNLDSKGNVTGTATNIAGLTGFINPVDIAEDNTSGYVYIADYGAQKLVLARPITPGAKASPSASTLYFNDDYGSSNTTPSKTQTLRITNTGTQPLSIPAGGLVLSDSSNWVITSQPTLPTIVAVGGHVDIGIAYRAMAASGAGIHTATLTITSNDVNQSSLVINLRGLAAIGTGGQNEPSLQRIMDLYQIPINVGDSNPSDTNLFSPSEPLSAVNDEVAIQRLVKAGSGNVTIAPLATYAGGSPAVRFGYYDAGTADSKTQLFTVGSADAQSVNPTLNGVTSFDPGSKDFGIYATFPIFGNTAYSEDALNTKELTVPNRRKVRFYQLKDADGNAVPNAYVFTTEDYVNDPTGSYDTNDFVGIIYNVAAAPAGPEIGLQNVDGSTFVNRLEFNRIQVEPPDPVLQPDGTTIQPPNNVVHDTASVRVVNTGSSPLTISSLVLSNAGWQIVNPPAAGTQIAAGGFLDVTIKFVATGKQPGQTGNQTNGLNANTGGAWSGTLTINSDDADEPKTVVQLGGYWQFKSENDNEPSLGTQINNVFGFGTTILAAGQQFDQGSLRGQIAAAGDEVLSPFWVRADSNMGVTVSQLSAYHTQGNGATVSWYNKATSVLSSLFAETGTDSQSIFPHNTSGTTAINSFTPTTSGSNPDGAFGFKIDGEWSDNTRNAAVAGNAADQGHHVRFFPAKDANGNVIANEWIMAMDYSGVNYDYNDNVYLVTNMRPQNPTAPTGLTATAQGAGINLAWNASTGATVTGYNIYRSTTATGTYARINGTPVTTASYTDLTAAAGTTYYYKITAADSFGGESAVSASASAARAPDTTPPAVVTGMLAQSISAGIQITWTADSDLDLAGYKIYRSTSTDGVYQALNGGQLLTTASFTDTVAQVGEHWYYKVAAVDTTGNTSVLSDAADATRTDSTAPSIPTGLSATVQTGGILLAWSAVGDLDLAGYKIYRSSAVDGVFVALNDGNTVSTINFTDTTAPAGQTSYYEVTAVDTSGNESALSTSANATMPSAPVVTPPDQGGDIGGSSGSGGSTDSGATGGSTNSPTPTPTANPVFSASAVARLPVSAVTGAKVKASVVVTVTNTTTTTQNQPVTFNLYLSSDTARDSSDVLAMTITRTIKLKAGKSTSLKLKLSKFASVPDGDYYLLSEVAPTTGDTVVKASASTVHLAAPFVSLSALIVKTTPAVKTGGKLGIRIAVTNNGNVTASGLVDLVSLLATDQSLATTSALSTLSKKIKIKAGGHEVLSLRNIVPAGTMAGEYFVATTVQPSDALKAEDASDATAISAGMVDVM